MTRQWFTGLCAAVLVVGLVVPAAAAADDADMPGLTGGETPWEKSFDEAMLQGRAAYNNQDWQKAVEQFTAAIQILPRQPAAYRNLARSYNLKGELEKATAYYDDYLELAGDASDADQIREERRGAIARGGDALWTTPADQRMARRALDRELSEGRAVTEGGGAWRIYQTLLSLGYARPDLQRLRGRMEAKVAEEFDEYLEAEDGFVPVLDEVGWGLQNERLEALDELARDEERFEWIERRRRVVQIGESLIAGDYEAVIELVRDMNVTDDEIGFVRWYRVVALERIGEYSLALEELHELLDAGVFEGEPRRRAEVVRATLLQRLDRGDEAAEVFEKVLRGL